MSPSSRSPAECLAKGSSVLIGQDECTDSRGLRLLSIRCERPHRRSANEANKFPPPHVRPQGSGQRNSSGSNCRCGGLKAAQGACKLRCPLWVLCHEHRRSKRRCVTVREMKEGPSRPAVRCRPQTAASCCRQKRW